MVRWMGIGVGRRCGVLQLLGLREEASAAARGGTLRLFSGATCSPFWVRIKEGVSSARFSMSPCLSAWCFFLVVAVRGRRGKGGRENGH